MAPRAPAPETGPDSFRVWEIKTQGKKGTSKEDDDHARALLEKTAWQVQPIMRKRGWRVGVLLEMPPKVRGRLGDNWNRGARVRLKLKKDDGTWEVYEQVLAVMLHELVHNEFGPHDGKFFARLAELEVECEDLMAKGVGGSGVGFDANSVGKLGHRGGWGEIETRDAKTAAIDAAQKRQKQHAAMGPPGGRYLGGSGGGAETKSPRSAAAQAAEKRAKHEAFAKEHGLMDDVVVLSDDDEEVDDEIVEVLEKAPETKKTNPKPKLQFSFQGLGKCPCCAVPRADETHVARCQATKAKSTDKNVQQPLEFETPASRDGGSAASSVHKKNPTPPSPRVESGKRKQKTTSPPPDVIVLDDSDDETPDPPARSRSLNNSKATPSNNSKATTASNNSNKTWRCGSCTLVNAEAEARCGACDLWRFSKGAPATDW